MLYTLIGNGNPNKKEVLSTLNSLMEAAGGVESFGLIFPEVNDPSQTLEAVTSWVQAERVYYESVLEAGSEGGLNRGFYESADEVYTAKRPLDRAIKLGPARKAPDEECAILIMSDDIDNDNDVLYAINKAIDLDIPVYDLGGQMVQIVLEEDVSEADVEPVLEHPAPEEFVLPHSSMDEDHELEFTRTDLEELTRDELKSLVQSKGVVPRDMRSKEALIDALMKTVSTEEEKEPSAEEPVVEKEEDVQGPSYFLLIINPDGEAEMRPLTAEQAALVNQ